MLNLAKHIFHSTDLVEASTVIKVTFIILSNRTVETLLLAGEFFILPGYIQPCEGSSSHYPET
jgi:hypothetical protein